ncbi:hypothetical protein PMAYCL1PPCAC_18109, partial [Pristionchus mayeri]
PARPAPPLVEAEDTHRTNITFTNSLSRRLDRSITSFTSEGDTEKEGPDEEMERRREWIGEGRKEHRRGREWIGEERKEHRRGSSVHVIYTHKRFSHSIELEDSEELAALHKEISHFELGLRKSNEIREYDQEDARSDRSSDSLRASRAFTSMQNVTRMDKELAEMPLHTSHSVSCVDECGKRHPKGLNIFELCEQHSYTDHLLTNVDFLCRLNFFANRLTEQIAEVAVRDIRSFYRQHSNPRARYFSDMGIGSHSNSDAMEEEEEEERRSFTVEPEQPEDVSSFGLFSFLAPKQRSVSRSGDRPRSALNFFSPSPSPTSLKRRVDQSDSSIDILHLVRRSSGVDSRASDSSPIPDHALAGLNEAEREHVKRVIESARKSSHSPAVSRRPSSTLPLHEMGDFSDTERAHIQQVLEKAESRGSSPFVIRVPSHGRVGRTDSSVSYDTPTPPPGRIITQASFSDDDYNSSMRSIDKAIRRAERESSLRDSPKNSREEEEKDKVISASEKMSLLPSSIPSSLPSSLPTETRILTGRRACPDRSDSLIQSEEKRQSPASPPFTIQGFKSFFGKTTSNVMNLTKKAISSDLPTHFNPISIIERRRSRDGPPLSPRPPSTISEVSEEEMEHMRRVTERAETEGAMGGMSPRPISSLFSFNALHEVSPMGGVSDAEMDQIRRINEMAGIHIDFTPILPVPSIEGRGAEEETILTEEEMEHLRKMEEMARRMDEEIMMNMERREEKKRDEEKEEMRKIEEMVERDEMMRVREWNEERGEEVEEAERSGRMEKEQSFTQEELDHIRRVKEAAEMDMREIRMENLVEKPRRSSSDESGETESEDEERSNESDEEEERKEEENKVDRTEKKKERGDSEERREEGERKNDEREEDEAMMISSGEYKREEEKERGREEIAPSRSRVSLESRRERKSLGGFSARSVEELQMDDEPSVNEWYEEQMAYMRESIADDEEWERREMEREESLLLGGDKGDNPPESVHLLRGSLHSPLMTSSSTVPQLEALQSIPVVGRESISSSSSVWREEGREDYPSPIPLRERSNDTSTSTSSSSLLGMFGGKKSGGFGFGGLGKIAGDAIGKAKAASGQLQQTALAAAAEMTKTTSSMSIPSAAKSVDPSPVPSIPTSPLPIHPGDIIPHGMEGLSEEERMKIMAVISCAELDSHFASVPQIVSPLPPSS